MKLNLFAFFITTMKPLTLFPVSFSSSCLCFLLVSSLCSICFCNKISDHVQCIPTERLALIDLKSTLIDIENRLSSWVGKDCCSWSGVVCDNITSHVHEIHLHGLEQKLPGTISPSVIKLLRLTHLDLSCNKFGGSIPAFIGSFKNLIYLNLSFSGFNGEIPHQLGNLSALRVLDLHHASTYAFSSDSLAWLKNLKGLQYLDMSRSNLERASDWFKVISNLTSLLELKLHWCELNRTLPNPTTVRFTSLVVLDLSGNNFDNMLPGWIFSLRKLTLLDLTECFISGVNPGTHGGFHNMPSLTTLFLSTNTFMNSSFLINGLASLSNLRELDVSECDISSPILGNLQNLSSIEVVDLSYNMIVEKIPNSLSNLCNITFLDLQQNNFWGDVSVLLERFCECESPKLEELAFNESHLIGQLPEKLGNLKNLISIDLSNNNFTGTIPESIGRLSKLSSLRLDNNNFTGTIPESIGRLSKLSSLSLNNNSLIGILTENHFSNLTALENMVIDDNKLVFKLNVNNWTPPFKLIEFRARSCSLGPQFPSWIQSQTDLKEIDISYANISDTIPNWFWTTIFPSVRYLNVSHNNIQGKLGDVEAPLGSILDLSNNRLHGPLLRNFSTVKFLDLSNNNISGSLEQFLCFSIYQLSILQLLEFLNLANNNMSGFIPDCWMGCPSLTILNLEKNQFSGIIPPSLEHTSLLSLDMDDNRLSGELPPWLLNSRSMVVIELARNELVGKIPSSIGSGLTSLRVLSLRSNKFEGKIPYEICHLSSLQILDLAHNDLSGNLPTCFTNFSVISGSETSGPIVLYRSTIINVSLVTKGNTYTYSTTLYLVTSIDLSSNKFSGSIPDELIRLLGLRFLNLSHNELTGTIPNSFNQTGMLESLDMSVNHVTGSIPLSLSQLTLLSWLNVSYNNLVGRIPTGRQLQTFSELSYTGNALCGYPLPACSQNNNGSTEGTTDRNYEPNGMDWILVILTLVGLIVGFWIILAPLFYSRRWRMAYYCFLERIWYKLEDFIFLLFLRRFRSR